MGWGRGKGKEEEAEVASHEYSIRLIENLKDADPRADITYVLMARVGGWLIELSRWNVSIRGTQIGVEIWSEGDLVRRLHGGSRRSDEPADDEVIDDEEHCRNFDYAEIKWSTGG